MPKQVPCLWFDGQAEQAAGHYTAIFPNSRITGVTRVPPDGPGPEGAVLTVEFSLDGQPYTGLNGGPQFTFNEAISFQITCETQQEIDYYWDRLTKGGDDRAQQCGWLKDKFGVSWQVVPAMLVELFSDPDREKTDRVMEALLPMKKLDIEALKRASEGMARAGR
jgi:predicted 3-demethylubiquinone-9 3-methyltransferase (glyoxalase superfamily)